MTKETPIVIKAELVGRGKLLSGLCKELTYDLNAGWYRFAWNDVLTMRDELNILLSRLEKVLKELNREGED